MVTRVFDRSWLDFAASFVAALSGAIAAAHAELDVIGLMTLAFATGLGGGVLRDVLIGAIPPASVRDFRYPLTAFAAATLVFFADRALEQIPTLLFIVFDAAALGLFAVSGTGKALLYEIPPAMSVLLGGITGVGGGALRDVLLARTPEVLHGEVYALAALSGAITMILAMKYGMKSSGAALLGAVISFAFRMLSVWQHWRLPTLI